MNPPSEHPGSNFDEEFGEWGKGEYAATATKRCPFCAEEIQAAALKCKHCGEFLDGRQRQQGPPQPNSIAPSPGSFEAELNRLFKPGEGRWNPVMALILSIIVPGLGQIYKEDVRAGVKWMIWTYVGYLLVLPGLVLHVMCCINAYRAEAVKSDI